MTDFLRIKRVQARSAGWIHMATNVVVLGIAVLNFLPRIDDPVGPILPWASSLRRSWPPCWASPAGLGASCPFAIKWE